MLKEDGWFCFENHYLGSILDGSQYDTIYHEHLRSLSISALVNLFGQYDFTVLKAQKRDDCKIVKNIRLVIAT